MKMPLYSGLRTWLIHPRRLTDKLIEVAGEASLQVLHQGFVGELWQREIVIMAQGDVCWYGRTMVPKSTYAHGQDFFDELKTKSLGELIYDSPMVERTSLMHYPVGHASQEFQWLPESLRPASQDALWLRSSFFMLRARDPFYLKEIFLPVMQRYCK